MNRDRSIGADTNQSTRPFAIERVVPGDEPYLFEGYSSREVAELVLGYHVAGVCQTNGTDVVDRWSEGDRKWFRFSDGSVRGYRVLGPETNTVDAPQRMTVGRLARALGCTPHDIVSLAGLSADDEDAPVSPTDEGIVWALSARL